jgi:hypothetical protein
MANKVINWSFAALQQSFGLSKKRTHEFPLLTQWINSKSRILSDTEKVTLEQARLSLEDNILFWNEEELKMYFISAIIRLIHYGEGIRGYFDREIGAKVQDFKLKSKADYMVAKGFGDIIETPLFCFHEYKQEKRPSEDPAAQVLKAMLIAQTLNNNQKPIYGCYVTGRNWYFVVLDQKNFAISDPFAATSKEDLDQIVSILSAFKDIIHNQLLI